MDEFHKGHPAPHSALISRVRRPPPATRHPLCLLSVLRHRRNPTSGVVWQTLTQKFLKGGIGVEPGGMGIARGANPPGLVILGIRD